MLLASAAMGAVYLVLLFLLCLGGVADAALDCLHRRARRGEEPEEEGADPPAPPPPPQPVYYIVEKKRTRAKQEYAAPREILFQK